MKPLLFKKINEVRDHFLDGDESKAISMVLELQKDDLLPAAKALIDALCNKFGASAKLVEQQQQQNVEKRTLDGITKLSCFDPISTKEGISIVSCCMNRNDNLLKGLNTWLKLSVDEIIIVDWSSTTPVSESLKDIVDARIKIVRVEAENNWVLTYGFNVGLRMASYSKIFKFDADIEVAPNFIELNQFNENEFIRGFWKSAIEEGKEDQVYVNGSFGCYKKHLLRIGFYNEFIRTYGWDDSDLYERLANKCGLAQKYLSFDSLLHLDQEEEQRLENQVVVKDLFLGEVPPTEFYNQRNKFLVRLLDYWSFDQLQEYEITSLSAGCWQAKRISYDFPIPEHILKDANCYSSLLWLGNNKYHWLQKTSDVKKLANILFDDYKRGIKNSLSGSVLGFEEGFSVEFAQRTLNSELLAAVNNPHIIVIFSSQKDHYSLIRNGIEISIRVEDAESVVSLLDIRNQCGSNQANINFAALRYYESNEVKAFIDELKNTNPKSQRKVFVDAQHGLGNRLRAIGSAAAIAKKTDRRLVIVWEPDHHCECHFSDLFDYNGEVIEASFIKEASLTSDVYNYMEIERGAFKDKEIKINENKDLYLRAAYTFNSPHSDWESENEFLRSLIPTEEILSLMEGFDLTNCIAAHVRMEAGVGLDHNTYDSVDNWTEDGHVELQEWRAKSHFSHFIKRIDKIFAQDESLTLFLAADMPEIYKVFEGYYGCKLIYLKREEYGRCNKQIKYALADAILLSKCERLLGSTWSSFSELAMRLSTTSPSIEMSGKDF